MSTNKRGNDLEQVGEIKFGQVGIANLRVKELDMDRLRSELIQKVETAPQLFSRAPLVVDLSHLPSLPSRESTARLLKMIHECGLLPVGLAYGTSENEELAQALDLPLLAKFRASFERDRSDNDSAPPPRAKAENTTVAKPRAADAATAQPTVGLYSDKPVRSGQQLYARHGDLVIANLVGNGAEVIADGSIHVYGALRGRALAGAQGDEKARIFCQEFHAELVSIAGVYRVIEDIPSELRGNPVQAWLENDKILLGKLA
ncbi:MAG: septum site-determining protein MinC [Dokdonella sp.]